MINKNGYYDMFFLNDYNNSLNISIIKVLLFLLIKVVISLINKFPTLHLHSNNTNFQSMFNSNFKKHFQSFLYFKNKNFQVLKNVIKSQSNIILITLTHKMINKMKNHNNFFPQINKLFFSYMESQNLVVLSTHERQNQKASKHKLS